MMEDLQVVPPSIKQELQRAQRQSRHLKRQLESIQASRTRKLMKMLHRIKARAIDLGRGWS
jgi:hypothetical protein